MKQLWFSATTFSPTPGEDQKTNPGRFGEALAVWLKARLEESGYAITEDPIAEDWGWVVMVQRKPYLLWVGCGNEDGDLNRWGLFVEVEQGLLQKLFHRVDPSARVFALENELERVVQQAGFENIEWRHM